mgnify:CR=1 FL=1
MIPQSAQKMIDDEAKRFYLNYIYGPPSFNYNPHKCFKSGASFAFELGFSQGIEAVISYLASLQREDSQYEYVQEHFKDQLRKTE